MWRWMEVESLSATTEWTGSPFRRTLTPQPPAGSALLDRYCDEIGCDPGAGTCSIHLPIAIDEPGITRDAIAESIDAGFRHIVLGLPAPYPAGIAQWVADELIVMSNGYADRRS